MSQQRGHYQQQGHYARHQAQGRSRIAISLVRQRQNFGDSDKALIKIILSKTPEQLINGS